MWRLQLLGKASTPLLRACTGMSWSGFRPSDDATKYGYNIPGNMYAVAALERASQLNADVWHDTAFAGAATRLAATIRCGAVLMQAWDCERMPGALQASACRLLAGREAIRQSPAAAAFMCGRRPCETVQYLSCRQELQARPSTSLFCAHVFITP